MPGITTTIGKDGRVVIPAEYRKKLGLKPGDEVMFFFADGELHVTTPQLALKYAKDMVERYIPEDRDLVSELIQERRDEAARE